MDLTSPAQPDLPPTTREPLWRALERAAAAAASLSFLAGLGLFAYTGTFARLWADDYCYSAVTQSYGLWGGVAAWYQTSGNRFSSVAAVAVSDWFGPGMVRVLPLLFLVLLLAAWAFFLFQLRGLARRQIGGYWLGLLALLQVYFLALLAPDRLQTVYWRMGMLHYALPLPFLLLQLGLVMRKFSQPGRASAGYLLALALLALFAGGNSETFAFLQLGGWGLGLLLALAFLRGQRRAWLLPLVLAPLAGSLLALLIMFFSPQNADRLAVMPPPENLWLTIPVTLRHAADFIFYAMRGQPVPWVVFLVGCAGLSLLSLRGAPLLSRRGSLLALLLVPLAAFALIAVSFFPSSYAGLQYPSGRALMPAAFILLSGLAGAVFFGVSLLLHLARLPRQTWLRAAALVLLLAASLYPLRAAPLQRAEQQRLAAWAERWDARDLVIRQSLAAGDAVVEVRELEVVRGLEDIGPNPDFWINRCAASYYGAQVIIASP